MDVSTLLLRPANNADVPAVKRLVFKVLREHGLRPSPHGTDADLRDLEASYWRQGGRFDVLIDTAGRILGIVGLKPVNPTTVELRKMYLDAGIRGRGQGRRLLTHALRKARDLGFRRVELETASVLQQAVKLYERAGFRRFVSASLATRCDAAFALDLSP
ncbi:MAG: GNAT family N-acetyltransferase [Verrucomicrobiales bacterium]|nr:GNAT family N-acetyltransferase [Verrucomicrobiales bacterium]MCP5526463.1 GNAT family N-acetyltransferase [Verrucomicrobiales bacterium]